jgi:hypothetical protein
MIITRDMSQNNDIEACGMVKEKLSDVPDFLCFFRLTGYRNQANLEEQCR